MAALRFAGARAVGGRPVDCLNMVTIPGGSFYVGAVEGDKYADVHEGPRTEVWVKTFALSRFPVVASKTNLPLVNVSWEEADAYCRDLGEGFRLPTEREWEYACRAGCETPFPGREGSEPDQRQVNYLFDTLGNRVGPGRLLPQGWGEANEFGIHDMLGNVCEWVADAWCPRHDDSVARDEGLRVIKGGAWDYAPQMLRPSWRDCAPPGTKRDQLGFRVARDLNEK